MEELVKKFIDSLIEQAKTEAAKLAKQKESEGHITVPQPLAESDGWFAAVYHRTQSAVPLF